MAQSKREVEITLHSIRVPVTGAGLDTETSHLLTAELVWPRTGVARKSASQPCGLVEGRADLARLHWGRRILFKESVEGRFALAVSLTEALDDEALEKALRLAAGAALAWGADAAAALWGPLARIAAAPVDGLAKEVAKYPGPTLLAEGLAELDAAELPAAGERLLTVRLTAARRLLRLARPPAAGRKPRAGRTALLEKHAPNGEVTLAVRAL